MQTFSLTIALLFTMPELFTIPIFPNENRVSPDAATVRLKASQAQENRLPLQGKAIALPTQQTLISPSAQPRPTFSEIMQAQRDKHERLMQEARNARMAESERVFKAREAAREAEKERRFRAREAEKDRQLIREMAR